MSAKGKETDIDRWVLRHLFKIDMNAQCTWLVELATSVRDEPLECLCWSQCDVSTV